MIIRPYRFTIKMASAPAKPYTGGRRLCSVAFS